MGSGLNLELAKAQIEEAKVFLESAKDDFKAERYARAIFNSQQCVELAMKSALTMHGVVLVLEHDVSPYFASEVITSASSNWVEPLKEVLRETYWLFEHYTLARYPVVRGRRIWRPSKEYRREQAEEAIKSAEKALLVISKYLKECFGV